MVKRRNTHIELEAPVSDEVLAFRSAVRDVRPLVQAATPAVAAAASKAASRARRRRPLSGYENLDELMPLLDPTPVVTGGVEPAPSAADATRSFQREGVQTQVMRRLRRGLFPIDAELDLHGMTQSIARAELARFIQLNRDRGHRCVRVIHGKGYRSGVRGPVLKIAVDFWLRRHLDVMAFTSARSIDGGTGALYVLLRA